MSEKGAARHVVIAKTKAATGELRKAVDAIYAYPEKGRLSLITRKAFNLLLARAMESGPEHEWYEISVRELARDIRYNSNDMKHLENTLNAMQTTILKWDILEEIGDRKRHVRNSIQLLGQVQIISGVSSDGEATSAKTIRYTFNSQIKQRLLVPEIYARINLQLQNEFSSTHTLALYEQVIRYKGNVSADGWAYTVKLPWREWRKLILSGESGEIYEEWKYFRRDVIMKAIKELNVVLTDFEVEVIVHKSGKLVSDLQFRLRQKAQPSFELLSEPRPIIDTESLAPRLERLGLTAKEIDRLVSNSDASLLEEIAAGMEARLKRRDLPAVRDAAAYFASELRRLKQSSYEAQASHVKSKKGASAHAKASPAQTEETKPRRTARTKAGQTDVEQRFADLPEAVRDAWIEKFASSLNNPAVVSEIVRKGVSGPIVRAVFIPWLRREFGDTEPLQRMQMPD